MNIALLVPALNEESAIARTAGVMCQALGAGIVQQAVVLDSGSTDNTSQIALQHGVDVLDVSRQCTEAGTVLGKGDSLWRGVATISADAYVFLDADLGNISVHHVEQLVSALSKTSTMFVKSSFHRVDSEGRSRAIPAGRVSEEVGRPLLELVDPWLAALPQPLSGQIAIRAELLRSLQLVTGYGIEIAMLIDIWNAVGQQAIATIDLGDINNRWKPSNALDDVRDHVLAGATLCGVTLPERGSVSHPEVVRRPALDTLHTRQP
jgi:glucosyl-3-phosphoglycerate synthase